MNLMIKTFVVLLATSLVLTSCSKAVVSVSPAKAMAKTLTSINDTKWNFVNYSVNKLPASFEKRANIEFKNLTANSVQYSGRNFVNYYGGTLKVDEAQGLIIQEDANKGFSTMMASDEASMKAEADFFTNLAKTKFFEISGDKLLLYLGDKTDSKTEVMHFMKVN